MLTCQGQEVYHYGVVGADVHATEAVDVVDEDTFERVHGVYDWRRDGWRIDRENECYQAFARNAILAIGERAKAGDFLLCPFGLDHAPIAHALPQLIAVESGIGYPDCFARWRVYESYAWLNFHNGKEGRATNPDWYHAVIPNGYDLTVFPFCVQKEAFHIFLGRPNHLKGRQIAVDVCRDLHIPLYVAGQGDRTVPAGVTHLGVLNAAQRALWVGHAAALWCPTYYLEPFGGVAVEAQLYGTPVITTDMGAFPETVLHGVTGYRCRTYEQFIWAAANVGKIAPDACRRWAAANYSLARVGAMYAEYFDMVKRVHDGSAGWYARKPDRDQLSWLAVQYP